MIECDIHTAEYLHHSRSPAFRVLDAVRTVDVSFRAQSMTKQLECLKKLHHAGIDLNARDKQGNTLLHRSVAHGLPAMTKWLLDNGVDPMIKNGSELYPAHMLLYGASTYVHTFQTKAALALMFVEHGVDIDVCSPQGDRGFEDVRAEPDIVAALQKRALEKQLEHVLPQGSNRRKM